MPVYAQTSVVTDLPYRQRAGNWLGLTRSAPKALKDKGYLYLSIIFLVAFWFQAVFELKWEWLADIQRHQVFQQCTGLGLLLYVAHQWYLSLLRTKKQNSAAKSHYLRHKQAGVLAPVIFYLHSTQFGYAYLFVLSVVYFANVVIGLCNQETLRTKYKWFSNSWIVVHVSLSVLIVVLTAFHVVVALIYE